MQHIAEMLLRCEVMSFIVIFLVLHMPVADVVLNRIKINVKNVKKRISSKHSVRATEVKPLKQRKSLCLSPWGTKLKVRPYKTSCCNEHL